jgi:hypothetical protein
MSIERGASAEAEGWTVLVYKGEDVDRDKDRDRVRDVLKPV